MIGDRIRDFRKRKGLSQEALRRKAKMHFTYIGSLERGEKNASVESLNRIAKGLDIRTERDLRRFEDSQEPE